MSLAGPYGEAVCDYCNHLIDLRSDGALERHSDRASLWPRCDGSLRMPVEGIPAENEKLAFSAEPVTHLCPVCNAPAVVATIAQTPSNYRLNSHYRIADQPGTGYCEGSGIPIRDLDRVVAEILARRPR